MRSSWQWTACLVAGLVAVVGPARGAETAAQPLISLQVDKTALDEVLRLLSQEAGINVIAHRDVASEPITIQLSNVPVQVALESITLANDLELRRITGATDIWIIQRRGAKAEDAALVSRVGGPGGSSAPLVGSPTLPTTRPPGTRPVGEASGALASRPSGSRPHTAGGGPAAAGARETISAKIPLKYLVASVVADWFDGVGMATSGTAVESSYVPWAGADMGTYDPYGKLRNNPRFAGYREAGATDATAMVRSRYTDFMRNRDSFGRPIVRDQFGDAGGRGGGPGGGLGGGGGGLGGGPGGGGQQGLERPEGIEQLIGFDLTSTLIVQGTPDGIEQLRELIELLDVPPKQIEIEARFVNLTVSEAEALGITWSMSNGSLTLEGSTPSGGGASMAIEYTTGNAQALLTAIQRTNSGKVVNAPKVSMQNGQVAVVAFQQDIPVTVSDTVTTDAASTVSTQIIPVPVTTALVVTARVTGAPPDESITTALSPQIADVIGFVDNPSGGTIPITSTQNVSTMIRVPNGETIALGGLIRKNNSEDSIKIPLLGDLPLIGELFRSKRINVDESELIIFITPTIIRDPSVGGPSPVQ